MTFPLTGESAHWLAIPFGLVFGLLLHRGGVADYNVIVNQFRFRDFTVLKIMLTAIIVGGVGVLVLHSTGHAQYHIKPANLLGVGLGAALFGVGMVVYGYCPGTGVAAIATGSLHALAGFPGMLAGAVLYAFSYSWVEEHIQGVAALGKTRLPELTGIPDWVWFAALAVFAAVTFWLLERKKQRCRLTCRHPSIRAAPEKFERFGFQVVKTIVKMTFRIAACAVLLAGEAADSFGADSLMRTASKVASVFPVAYTNVPPGLPQRQFRTFYQEAIMVATNSVGGAVRTPRPTLIRTNGVPEPGVYKTESYTCLVLVPGSHADDIALAPKGGPAWPRIRQHTPDLRFVPKR